MKSIPEGPAAPLNVQDRVNATVGLLLSNEAVPVLVTGNIQFVGTTPSSDHRLAVSIDRLKPAFTLIDTSPDPIPIPDPNLQQRSNSIPENLPPVQDSQAQEDVRRTRSGRKVHFPDFYRPS
ncbi:unnamed protein product [Danaus chrysippus]|uniref:(African queen) hypothetical protein n=1 Tax=Danaus chrysippus TaxID=151541 RepID=A0A8J2QVB9_9NEOP|nr:unnamed protein product [Danaus chrysippus]